MRPNKSIGQRPNFEIDYNDWKNTDEIQKFINKQLWVAGGLINTNTTNVVNTTVKWGGQSRFLCGFNFYANNPTAHTLSIVLNQETILDSIPLIFMQPLGNLRFIQYFEFIRPLSGSDVLIFSLASTVAETVNYGVYMTRAYNKYYTRD
jgi:hypothetical protein